MTYIQEQMRVDCSSSGALAFLDRAGAQVPEELLPPRASLRFFGERFKKDVALSYEPQRGASCFERRIAVWWEPIGGGPYPSFAGTIALRAQNDDVLVIDLYGQYTPPFGALGTRFDLVAGRRIARQTARFLLRHIALKITESGQAGEIKRRLA